MQIASSALSTAGLSFRGRIGLANLCVFSRISSDTGGSHVSIMYNNAPT